MTDILHLGGASYALCPSLAALQAAEKATGRGMLQLPNTNMLPIGDLAVVAGELIRAGGAEPPARMVTLIYEAGAVDVAAHLALVLTEAVCGERMADGTARATE